MTDSSNSGLRVDIISDVVCPWCAVGYSQLAFAARRAGVALDIHWQPFELNPDMAAEGEDLRAHLAAKYGSTPQQSAEIRKQLTDLGAPLGFAFHFADDMRIYNTFQAHQLIDWAEQHGAAHRMKLALLEAYFTKGQDISDRDTLVACVQDIGLDDTAARTVLESGAHSDAVRQRETFWIQQGIRGVPAMVFGQRHLVTGAQGVETYTSILEQLTADTQA